MKILIYLIPFIGISSATFARLLGGAGLNSILGASSGFLGSSLSGFSSLDNKKNLGGSADVEENFISIIDQLGPGKVIEHGTLRKRIPKTSSGTSNGLNLGNLKGSLAHTSGGAAVGGAYHSGGISGGHGGHGGGHETIVNIYGDPSGGYENGIIGSSDIGNHGITVIRVIHEYAGSNGGSYASGHSHAGSGPVTVYKIIENSSYGGQHHSSSSAITSAIHSSDAVHSGGWSPIKKGW